MIKSLPIRLAEIGKIKIGGKGPERTSKSGKKFRIPQKYDHFVIVKNEKDQYGNFIIDKNIQNKIGNECRKIPIVLLFDDINLNLLSSFQYYHGHKCVCRGDGETAERIIKGEKKLIPCPNSECEFLQAKRCKPSGLLSCMLPLAESVGGVYKFRTTSWNTVSNLQSSLALIKMQTGGNLAGIPLYLEMIKKQTEEHGAIEMVNIGFDGSIANLQKAAIAEEKRREQLKIDISKVETIAIESGVIEDNDDPQDVEDEFYTDEKKGINHRLQTIDADAFATPAKTMDEPEVKEESIENKNPGDIL